MKKRREIEVFLGGESACYAHLLCETCGGVLDDAHVEPCPVDDQGESAARVFAETERHPATS